MKKVLLLTAVVAVAATSSFGALAAPVIDTTDFLTIAGSVLLATGVFFGVRKAIGLLN